MIMKKLHTTHDFIIENAYKVSSLKKQKNVLIAIKLQ